MRRALLSLSVFGLAGAALAADFGFLRPLRVFRVTSKDPEQVLHVQEAVRVRDRYLAVVLTTSRTREGRERLKELYGVAYFLAPAWFSDRWELLRLGDGLFAGLREVTPTPLQSWQPSLLDPLGFPRYPVHRFPQVLVREAGASWCPYLIVTTTQVACLDESLRLGSRWETPVQVMDYFLWQGRLWMAGYHEGHLLHQVDLVDEGTGPYDIRPVRIARSVLTLGTLRDFLSRRGYTLADLRDLETTPWETGLFAEALKKRRQEMAEHPEKFTVKDREGRRYVPLGMHRALRPFHFPMAATAQGERAYIVLHRPFGVVVVQLPEGQVLDFWPIRREELPPSMRDYTRPAVWSVVPVRNQRLFINLALERDISYREFQATHPTEAAELARNWTRMRQRNCSDIIPCDEPLTPETVVGAESASYGLEVTGEGRLYRVYSLEWSDGHWSRSVLALAFFPGPEEMWLSIRADDPAGGVLYGVARFDW
jgi:hypothetical protein